MTHEELEAAKAVAKEQMEKVVPADSVEVECLEAAREMKLLHQKEVDESREHCRFIREHLARMEAANAVRHAEFMEQVVLQTDSLAIIADVLREHLHDRAAPRPVKKSPRVK